jgi:hypothetical protein
MPAAAAVKGASVDHINIAAAPMIVALVWSGTL